jgi:hypothetical protein
MIHVFKEDDGHWPHWAVWSDTEAAEKDGRCIGVGITKLDALRDARAELVDDGRVVQLLLDEEADKQAVKDHSLDPSGGRA